MIQSVNAKGDFGVVDHGGLSYCLGKDSPTNTKQATGLCDLSQGV